MTPTYRVTSSCRATIVEARDKPNPQVKVSIYGNPVWLDSSPELLDKARGLIGQLADVSATFDRCQLDTSTLGGQLRSIRALADSDTVKVFDDWFASLPPQEWCEREP